MSSELNARRRFPRGPFLCKWRDGRQLNLRRPRFVPIWPAAGPQYGGHSVAHLAFERGRSRSPQAIGPPLHQKCRRRRRDPQFPEAFFLLAAGATGISLFCSNRIVNLALALDAIPVIGVAWSDGSDEIQKPHELPAQAAFPCRGVRRRVADCLVAPGAWIPAWRRKSTRRPGVGVHHLGCA